MKLLNSIILIVLLLLSGCFRWGYQQFDGYVEGENIYLASPFYGVLQQLMVQRGQKVKKGQLLFVLDSNPQKLNIEAAHAEQEQALSTLADLKKPRRAPEIEAIVEQIEQTKAQIQLAQLRVSRLQRLYEKQATDKDSLDAAVANLQQYTALELQYEANLSLAKLGSRVHQIAAQQYLVYSATAKLDIAKWELAQKTLYAPADGVIFDTYFRLGEFVSAQQPVLSLLTPENIRIEFFVPLNYLSRIKVGQKVVFNCEGCKHNNLAEIQYVSPVAEYLPPLVYSRENNSKLVFRIKAKIKNPTLFKPGQPVVVHLL